MDKTLHIIHAPGAEIVAQIEVVLISPGLVGWEWSADWSRDWARIVDAARNRSMAEARELWIQHPLFDS